jgi:cobalamin biosynthesis protein CobD/CbiB
VASAAHSAADAVTQGAEYLRANDVQTMKSDLMEVVRRNPGPALLGAAAVGFLLGRALSRD